MRGRERIHVEYFAIGRVAAVEIVAVPGGHADRAVIDVLLRQIFAAADHVWLADAVDAAALRHRLARLDYAGAGRGAVSRIDPAGHVAIGAIGEGQTTGRGCKQTR